jgi:hypothetical protein
MLTKLDTTADVYRDVDPEDWVVSAVDPPGDGRIFSAIFSGLDAEQRALEYAAAKFRGFQRHDPDQRPHQSCQPSSAAFGQSPIRGATLRLAK